MHNNEQHHEQQKEHQPSHLRMRMSVMVLQKLEVKKYRPTSKAYFVLRNALMWSLAIFSIIFGALSISGILFRVSNITQIHPTPLRFDHMLDMFPLFPLFWMAVFGLFVYIAFLEIRHTDQGYKYHLSWIIGSMFAVSSILGIALYYLGVGFILDKAAARIVPFNRDVETIQEQHWFSPERGYLVGKVLQAEDSQEVFVLRDPNDTMWEVFFSGGLSEEEKDMVREDRTVGLEGMISEKDKHLFIACKIRSVEIQGRGKFIVPPSRVQMLVEMRGGTSSERNLLELRTNVCEGVRPQQEVVPVN